MSTRWIAWCIGFFGAFACIGLTVAFYLADQRANAMLAQTGVFLGVAIFMLANPHHR
jgi:hypothetical protein